MAIMGGGDGVLVWLVKIPRCCCLVSWLVHSCLWVRQRGGDLIEFMKLLFLLLLCILLL